MPRGRHTLSEDALRRILAALLSEIQNHFGITAAAQLLRASGLLPTATSHWAPLMAGVSDQFTTLSMEEKERTVVILAGRLMTNDRPDVHASVAGLLRQHGYQYSDGIFVPAEYTDPREVRFLTDSSVSAFATALARLTDGDIDGAMTSACGAVDTAAADVYARHSMGDPARVDSFQQRAIAAIQANGKLVELKTQLLDLGWSESDARMLSENLRGSLNQAAFVLQSLRARMSDVHGERPALESAVFDVIKFASILTSLMK